jgi:hypothetical protein
MSGNSHCCRLRRIRLEFMKIAARKTTAASKAGCAKLVLDSKEDPLHLRPPPSRAGFGTRRRDGVGGPSRWQTRTQNFELDS